MLRRAGVRLPVRPFSVRGPDPDDNWEEMRNHVRAVVEGCLEETGGVSRGMIMESTRQKMVALHKRDRQVYTATKLAQMFGLPRTNVSGVLTLGLMEDTLPSVDEEAFNEGQTLLESKFGIMRAKQMELNREQHHSPGHRMQNEEVDPLRDGWAKQQGRPAKLIPPSEVPAYPNPPEKHLWESVQLHPREDRPMRKYRIVVVDTSKRYADTNRPIYIKEFDRSVRTADWNERRSLINEWRGRRRNMRRGTGAILMETVSDLDRMYRLEAMSDLSGIPDYWPNNDMPVTDIDAVQMTKYRLRRNPRVKDMLREGEEEREVGLYPKRQQQKQ